MNAKSSLWPTPQTRSKITDSVASMRRSGIEEAPATALTPTPALTSASGLRRPAGEGAEPMTPEQRLDAIEGWIARVSLGAHNVAFAAQGAPPAGLFAKTTAPATEALVVEPQIPDAATAPYVRRVVCSAVVATANVGTATGRYTVAPQVSRMFLAARHGGEMQSKEIAAWLRDLTINGGAEIAFDEQGFIDQHNVFMTRQEALAVAKAAGQIRCRCGGDDDALYSENLY